MKLTEHLAFLHHTVYFILYLLNLDSIRVPFVFSVVHLTKYFSEVGYIAFDLKLANKSCLDSLW